MSVPGEFESTRWSLVLEAGHEDSASAREALEALCHIYWYPLYTYLRRQGIQPQEAEDLVQGFVARLLEKNMVAVADRDRGRFRSFLLTALSNFLSNERAKSRAQKRGGGVVVLPIDFSAGESRYSMEPVHNLTAERIFEREWAVTLLDRVTQRLRGEFTNVGKREQFECLKVFLAGRAEKSSHKQAAGALGISEAAVATGVSRLRRRYRDLLRLEISRTLANPQDVNDEIRRLFDSLGT